MNKIYSYFKNLYISYQKDYKQKRYRSGFEWACTAYLLDKVRMDVIEAITWDEFSDSPENKGARDALKCFRANSK